MEFFFSIISRSYKKPIIWKRKLFVVLNIVYDLKFIYTKFKESLFNPFVCNVQIGSNLTTISFCVHFRKKFQSIKEINNSYFILLAKPITFYEVHSIKCSSKIQQNNFNIGKHSSKSFVYPIQNFLYSKKTLEILSQNLLIYIHLFI